MLNNNFKVWCEEKQMVGFSILGLMCSKIAGKLLKVSDWYLYKVNEWLDKNADLYEDEES